MCCLSCRHAEHPDIYPPSKGECHHPLLEEGYVIMVSASDVCDAYAGRMP